MAQNVQIQTSVNTAEGWAQLVKTQGLVVVDVHSSWCGPCLSILSTFKRFYYEFSDRKLVFAVADCDQIPQLSEFRGHAQSTFLFYKDGSLVESVVGVEMPAIVKHIKALSPFKDDYESEDEVFVDEDEDVAAQIVPAPSGLQDATARAQALGGLLTPPPGFAEEEPEEEDEADIAVEGETSEGKGDGDEDGDGTDTAGVADDDTAAGDDGTGDTGSGAGEEKVPQPPKGRPPSGNPRRPASGTRKGR